MIRTETIATPAPAAVPSSIVERMAERMREMGMNNQPVTAETLFEGSDFTRAEIREHGADAADLARARSVRRLD